MKKRTRSKSRARKRAAPSRKRAAAKAPVKIVANAAALRPLDDFITAGTRALGFKVEKSWMPAVRANLRVTLDLGAMVAEFPLPDDAEPAPVFRA